MTTINRSCKISQYPRSSRPEVLCKKVVLKDFAKLAGNKVFFNNVAGLRPATLFKKRLRYGLFLANFANFF